MRLNKEEVSLKYWLKTMNNDPRLLRALKTLRETKYSVVVMSSKGGVGKTTLSVLLSLLGVKSGITVGLLDLDFVNPSTHIMLGLSPKMLKYEEKRGILPYNHIGLKYFSIVAYTGDRRMALRGDSVENALWEVLSIVNWGNLDLLFIDTPPGLSDEHLSIIYKLRTIIIPLIVATPSPLSLNSTRRLLELLTSAGYRDIYLVENMGSGELLNFAEKQGLRYLGYVSYNSKLDQYIGYPIKLLDLAREINIEKVFKKLTDFLFGTCNTVFH